MPFDWRDFLAIAHELRHDRREGVQRTCLGRAYYYIYNLGLQAAKSWNFNPPPHSVHKQLWNWCLSHPDQQVKRMGVHAQRMYRLRISADYYDTAIPNLASEVKRQIARAHDFESLVAAKGGRTPPARLVP